MKLSASGVNGRASAKTYSFFGRFIPSILYARNGRKSTGISREKHNGRLISALPPGRICSAFIRSGQEDIRNPGRSPKEKLRKTPRKKVIKKLKKVLDKGRPVWYISRARLRETGKRAKRTLKTIQRKERARRKKTAKIPEEFSTERC